MALQVARNDRLQMLPWPTFPEQIVIRELLGHSGEFRAFYQAQRGKIVETVHWVQDSSLPLGIDYRMTLMPIGTSVVRVIRLRNIPASLNDAMQIAHELQHLVLDAAGYPKVFAVAQFESLSSALTSMIHDPIVNATLRQYGFDLVKAYQAEAQESMRQLQTIVSAPSNPAERIRWIFNYTSKMLDWEVVSVGGEKNEFQIWFDARYPDIVREAQKLLRLIHSIGYDIPVKQLLLFREIIQNYQLEAIIGPMCDAELLESLEA